MTKPISSTNTLLLIALMSEAQDILPADAAPYWVNDKSPNAAPQQAYRFDKLTIGITGPLGHSFLSVGLRLLLGNRDQDEMPFTRMVNFGAAGKYPWSDAEVLSAYFVREARRWDETIPARGFEFYTAPAKLAVPDLPDGETTQVCLSSNRFSSDFDRQTHQMLDGDLEDFELYDMARVASLCEIPFYSIKFVTNVTTPEGASEFFQNLAPARKVGTCKLREFLETAVG